MPSLVERALFTLRNRRYAAILDAVATAAGGTVLDVGGGVFVDAARRHGARADRWFVAEVDAARLPAPSSGVGRFVADAAALPLPDGSVDCTLCIHVLEHVFEPLAVADELRRVTRPGGRIVVVVPQTANLHEVPHHYQNFTRFWVEQLAVRLGCEVERLDALGGAWSTIASRLALQPLAVAGVPGRSLEVRRRGWRFWLLQPLAALVSIVGIPIALLLSAADLEEEANNHLLVLRVPAGPA